MEHPRTAGARDGARSPGASDSRARAMGAIVERAASPPPAPIPSGPAYSFSRGSLARAIALELGSPRPSARVSHSTRRSVSDEQPGGHAAVGARGHVDRRARPPRDALRAAGRRAPGRTRLRSASQRLAGRRARPASACLRRPAAGRSRGAGRAAAPRSARAAARPRSSAAGRPSPRRRRALMRAAAAPSEAPAPPRRSAPTRS